MKRIGVGIVIIMCVLLIGCRRTSNENKKNITCTISVECGEALKNQEKLTNGLKEYIPKDGVILDKTEVMVKEDGSVYDVLKKVLKEQGILMEASFTGDMAYIEGIDNLYEFSCGNTSGWMYCVNGKYGDVSCSSFRVSDGDVIEWHYTCDLGSDLGEQYTGE